MKGGGKKDTGEVLGRQQTRRHDVTMQGLCWDAQSCQQSSSSLLGFVEANGQGCVLPDMLIEANLNVNINVNVNVSINAAGMSKVTGENGIFKLYFFFYDKWRQSSNCVFILGP